MKKEEEKEVLLVREKENNNIEVVTGMSEKGDVKSVTPENKNKSKFLLLDNNNNVLENFMKNFWNQCKNPYGYDFFKVPAIDVESYAAQIKQIVDEPEAKEVISTIKVEPSQYNKPTYKPISEDEIDWGQLNSLGITKETLEKTKCLENLLNYKKTPILLSIKAECLGQPFYTDARLSLRRDDQGKVNIAVHPHRHKPNLNVPFFGLELTALDKLSLLNTGHLGRLADLNIKGQIVQSFVSLDKLTNELVAVRADKIKIPDELKEVPLTQKQQQALREGRSIYLTDMVSKNGSLFSAKVTVSADTRNLSFEFLNNEKQSKNQKNDDLIDFKLPNTLLGKELSEEDKIKLRKGETIFLTGLTKNNKVFDSFIKISNDQKKLEFMSKNYQNREEINRNAESLISSSNTNKTQRKI